MAKTAKRDKSIEKAEPSKANTKVKTTKIEKSNDDN
jgi:hypothetical protein